MSDKSLTLWTGTIFVEIKVLNQTAVSVSNYGTEPATKIWVIVSILGEPPLRTEPVSQDLHTKALARFLNPTPFSLRSIPTSSHSCYFDTHATSMAASSSNL